MSSVYANLTIMLGSPVHAERFDGVRGEFDRGSAILQVKEAHIYSMANNEIRQLVMNPQKSVIG